MARSDKSNHNLDKHMVKPVTQNIDLVDKVYVSLRDAICEGHFAPGERLNQDQLAAQLQVSRQPVAQAIQILKSQGFVCDTGRRGVEIAPLNINQITHLYQIRSALDALAAREAALNNSKKAGKEGRQLIKTGRRICKSGSIMEMIKADMGFHRFIYKLSGNPEIDTTIAPHWYHLTRIMGQVLKDFHPRQKVWDEHEAILEAICAGDAEKAQKLAQDHGEQAAIYLSESKLAIDE